jgi:two-component system response regulator MprA
MQSAPERRTILIAERDPSVRELQEHFLGVAGFAVEFAGNGLDALERARLLRPAVVITEILIPKLDGLALCRRLGEDPETRHIPVLVFSILAAAPRAAEAGAKAYLRKPLVESLFVATVRQLIVPPVDILETQ